ncbi:MAG: DUF2148 domain-containing protein [Bacteroidales bacterium]|jgi:uncharacterized ferredoxin-like protein|nr:DUF2148 domain-containing protein [Bacteroidales bacterium]
MTTLNEQTIIRQTVLNVAQLMVTAAITAPKGRGISHLHTCIVVDEDKQAVIEQMRSLAKEFSLPSFERDARNLENADALVLLGTALEPMGLKLCGMCGFENCDAKRKQPHIPCVFNPGDLGIALGSAVSVAMDNRIDNRILYSAGQAALRMGIFPPEVKIIYGVALSVSKKNIFFDR